MSKARWDIRSILAAYVLDKVCEGQGARISMDFQLHV